MHSFSPILFVLVPEFDYKITRNADRAKEAQVLRNRKSSIVNNLGFKCAGTHSIVLLLTLRIALSQFL